MSTILRYLEDAFRLLSWRSKVLTPRYLLFSFSPSCDWNPEMKRRDSLPSITWLSWSRFLGDNSHWKELPGKMTHKMRGYHCSNVVVFLTERWYAFFSVRLQYNALYGVLSSRLIGYESWYILKILLLQNEEQETCVSTLENFAILHSMFFSVRVERKIVGQTLVVSHDSCLIYSLLSEKILWVWCVCMYVSLMSVHVRGCFILRKTSSLPNVSSRFPEKKQHVQDIFSRLISKPQTWYIFVFQDPNLPVKQNASHVTVLEPLQKQK